MKERPPFPQIIDSSILGYFRSCPQKYFRTYLEHWKPKGESVHLVAGAAFAAGVERARRSFFILGRSPADSVAHGHLALMEKYGLHEAPEGSAKTLDRMLGALNFYFDAYPLDDPRGVIPASFGQERAVEFSFAEPLPFVNPETGDPVLYVGRSDCLAEYAGGRYVVDEKTTTSLGPSWSRQWDLRSQFTGYCWAAREGLGWEPNGVLVRGISILKTKYDTQEVMTHRSPWMINRWLEQTVRDLTRMQRCWEEGYWDYDLDHACTEYGGCPLKQVCTVPPAEAEVWLPMYFTRRIWNPLTREETAIDAELESQHVPAGPSEVITVGKVI